MPSILSTSEIALSMVCGSGFGATAGTITFFKGVEMGVAVAIGLATTAGVTLAFAVSTYALYRHYSPPALLQEPQQGAVIINVDVDVDLDLVLGG